MGQIIKSVANGSDAIQMRPKVSQLDALTGLRFVAAMVVFVHHTGNKFGMPQIRGCLGAMAVSFFFVLSGFILTYVYHGRLNRGGVKRFYFTRWARIWPLHFVCLLLVLFLWSRWYSFGSGGQQLKLLLNGALLQSWWPYREYVFSFNGVSWSISTELFFYLMFPLFLIGGQRKFWFKYTGLLLFAVVAIFSLQALANVPSWAMQFEFIRVVQANPLLRLPEFCTGMAVGYIFLNRQAIARRPNWKVDSALETLAVGTLVAYAVAFSIFRPDALLTKASWGGAVLGYWVRFSGGAILFAAVVYIFATRKGFWSKLLSTRSMVFLGEISFAFYMTHMIVIRAVDRYDWFGSPVSSWILALCCLVIALCLSTILFKLVEVPAKVSLLETYDGTGWKSFMRVPQTATQFMRQPLAIATVAILVCAIGYLRQNYQPVLFSPQAQSIVHDTDSIHREVAFGSNVRLIGFTTTEDVDGIQLNLVWQKLGDLDRPRFVHICDNSGKTVASVSHRVAALADANRGDAVVDTIHLTRKQLVGGAKIGVGFYSKEKGCAKVRVGPRTTGNWRFTLVDKPEYRDIVQSGDSSPFRNVSFGK